MNKQSMLRAIIIDDEQQGIDNLILLVNKFSLDIKIVAHTTSAIEGITLIEDYRPDVIFLDIQMPFLSGFELLEKLSFRDFSLIFTTAYNEYGLQALKNNALDYLLKPLDADDLENAITKVRNRLKSKKEVAINWEEVYSVLKPENKQLVISSSEGVSFELYANIIRLQAHSNYTVIHLANGKTHTLSKTLKGFEEELCQKNNRFCRVHSSHIINLDHVRRYLKEDGGQIIMSDNAVIRLSRAKKEEFLAWLGI